MVDVILKHSFTFCLSSYLKLIFLGTLSPSSSCQMVNEIPDELSAVLMNIYVIEFITIVLTIQWKQQYNCLLAKMLFFHVKSQLISPLLCNFEKSKTHLYLWGGWIE